MGVFIKAISKIDRMRMTGLGLLKKQKQFFFTQFLELKYFINITLKNKKGYVFTSKKMNTDYRKALLYRLDAKHPVAMIEVGITKAKYCYLAWELWPENLPNSDFEAFHKILFLLLGEEPIFHYGTAFYNGKVKYIELAVDMLTPEIHGYIYWKHKTRKSEIHEEEETKEKGSIYVGKETSNLQFVIYDKVKRLKKKGVPTPWKRYTRIEARLRNTGLAPYQLTELENPFPKLNIASAIDCKNHSTDPEWHQFIDTALEKGSAIAFSGLSKYRKKKYKKWLSLYAVKFWKPQIIMNSFDKAIEPIKPENLFSSTSTISV